ncbi:BatA domain-containing protein [Leeuwenhoekiella aequorea]|uniref:Putative membrane protein (TIGR02226 family) n=1 Tax=Leeuwenhoekiella aequorea TaxID=283736 RepID=A0A4Q0P2I2_9FLAO|nr:BatA domain-containing protein [Leeuwenhoekiella aequorea]RXG20763.1 putative membrane protein (TIGR02226 family) [Leeuwenhoekiella aequorea]
MQFKNPEILYALFLLLIPILIHLFQLRRFKKTPFTNVVFLQNVIQNTRKSSSIKKWLILAIRLIALACLVIAFAQPYLPASSSATKPKETVVFIDNSYSMQATGKKGNLLTEASQDLLSHLSDDQLVTLVTWDEVFKNFNVQKDRDILIDLDFTSKTTDSKSLLLRLNTLFSKDLNTEKRLVLVSDFQDLDLSNLADTSSVKIYPVVLDPVAFKNFSIDSLTIERNADLYNLNVLISSSFKSEDQLPVSLYNGNELIAKSSVKFSASDTASTQFQLPADKAIKGLIRLDDAALEYDNSFYFSINNALPLKVLAITDESFDFLKKLYSAASFEFVSVSENQLDYALLADQNLIILNEINNIPISLINSLKAHTQKGGTVILIPSTRDQPEAYSNLLTAFGMQTFTKTISTPSYITGITYDHPLFQNVFSGRSSNLQSHIVNSYSKLNTNNPILTFENGDPFLTENNNLYVFTASLSSSNSNFIKGQLIVPTFDKMALQALSLPKPYYTLGTNATFDIKMDLTTDAALVLERKSKQYIPLQQKRGDIISVSTSQGITNAGLFEVKYKSDTLTTVAFNHDRKESKLQSPVTQTKNKIEFSSTIKSLFDTLEQESNLNLFYKWFVIFALLAFLAEMLLLKFLK